MISDGKGKAVPLQAYSGPEGSRKLRFPDFMTTAQDGGKVVSLRHWPPLPPGNAPGTHLLGAGFQMVLSKLYLIQSYNTLEVWLVVANLRKF